MADFPASRRDRDWDGHLLLLSRSEHERREAVALWARRGLERGERIVYTQRPTDASERSVTGVLGAKGWDVEALQTSGQLQVLPLRDFFPAAGPVVHLQRALADGFAAVRISTEERSVLSVLSPQEHAQVEATLQTLCREQPISALCQYSATETPPVALRDGFRSHPRVRDSGFDADPRDGGIAVTGEVDLQNADVLEAAVHHATQLADELFWVDLSRVTFLDVTACHALARATHAFRSSGGDVVLHGAPPNVDRLIRLVGLDDESRISLVEERP